MSDAAKAQQKDLTSSYLDQSRDLVNALVLCLPVLLIYEVGLLLREGATLNGVDFFTVVLVTNFGFQGLLVFNAVIFIALLGGIAMLKKKRQLNPKILVPVVIESTVYALLLGTVILVVMSFIPGLIPEASTTERAPGLVDRVLLSLGAGFHEELVFRLLMFSGMVFGLKKIVEPPAAVVVSVVLSSVIFSLAHYLGPENFNSFTFVYRFLAGAIFCAIFCFRGFAVAVYTHAIYDIYVMVFRASAG